MPQNSSSRLSSQPSSRSISLKRNRDALSTPLSNLGTPPKKLRRNKPNVVDNQVYQDAGKRAACLLDPFVHPSVAFKYGMLVDSGATIPNSKLAQHVLKRYLAVYEGIISFIPDLRDRLESLESSGKLKRICDMIWTGVSIGRSQDFASVKHEGLKYLTATINAPVDPPFALGTMKSDRGFHHPLTARLLCPRRERDGFDADPERVRQLLLIGTIPATHERMPSYLYPEDIYDPDDPRVGLFQSDILVRFYRHLFVGPKAAATGALVGSRSKPAKNLAYGLTNVSYRGIAWVTVVIYYTLSAAETWIDGVIGAFNLNTFFGSIVSLFEDETDPWTHETLEWWNEQIFGFRSTTPTDDSPDAPRSDFRVIKALQAVQSDVDTLPIAKDVCHSTANRPANGVVGESQSSGNSSASSAAAATSAGPAAGNSSRNSDTTTCDAVTCHQAIPTGDEPESASRGPSRVFKVILGLQKQ